MRIDTDDIERARGRKKVGRKHNHQPRGRAIQRAINRRKAREQLEVIARQRFNRLVAAYWRGHLESHP